MGTFVAFAPIRHRSTAQGLLSMSASTLSARAMTRLPVPQLFMGLSIAIFALMAVLAFAPAGAAEADPAPGGLGLASLVVLPGLLWATLQAGRRRAHGAGRPIQGLVAGLFAGVAGTAGLYSLGVITLDSPGWILLPLVLSTVGTALGATAPFPRSAHRGVPPWSS